MVKKQSQITIKIWIATLEKWEKWRAEYIGKTKKNIDRTKYLDLLRKPK